MPIWALANSLSACLPAASTTAQSSARTPAALGLEPLPTNLQLTRHLPGTTPTSPGLLATPLALLLPSGQHSPWPAHRPPHSDAPLLAQPCPQPQRSPGTLSLIHPCTHAHVVIQETVIRVPGHTVSSAPGSKEMEAHTVGERQNRKGGQGGPRVTDVLEGEDATPLLRNVSPCTAPCAHGPGPQPRAAGLPRTNASCLPGEVGTCANVLRC